MSRKQKIMLFDKETASELALKLEDRLYVVPIQTIQAVENYEDLVACKLDAFQ